MTSCATIRTDQGRVGRSNQCMTREGPAPMSGYSTLRSSRSQPSTSARSQSAAGIGAQLRTKYQCDQLPDFRPDRGRLLALGDDLGRPAAVLPVRSPASLQTFGRARSGTRAAMHPAAAIRHRRTATGRSTASTGAASGRFQSHLKRLRPDGRMGFIGLVHCSPSGRWAPRPELLTVPATMAWPPSDTCTCCTVTTCRPPVLIRRRPRSAPTWSCRAGKWRNLMWKRSRNWRAPAVVRGSRSPPSCSDVPHSPSCQRRRENASPWRSKDASGGVMTRARARGPCHLGISRAGVGRRRTWASADGACSGGADSSRRSSRGCGRDE